MKSSSSRRLKQVDLFYGSSKNLRSEFGGVDLKSHPKGARPTSTKHFMHLTLKTLLPSSSVNFVKYERAILLRFHMLAKKLGLAIKEAVIMTNHCHMVVKLEHRSALKAYFRAASSFLRSLFKLDKTKKLFSGRPFTRFVRWGRDLVGMLCYCDLNKLEKKGISKDKGRVILKKETKTEAMRAATGLKLQP